MNKRNIIVISLLAILLVGGIAYSLQDKNEKQNKVSENNMSNEENDDKQVEIEGEEEGKESKDEIEDIKIKQGEPAPDFTLETLSGKEVSLSDYKGKIVMINFWATWCKYCDKEMPDMQKLYNKNKDDDFVVLAINVGESKKTAEKYINEEGYNFPVLLDNEGEIANTYLVSGLPTSYYIDKEGNLIGGVPGMMTYPQMNQVLEQIKKGEL